MPAGRWLKEPAAKGVDTNIVVVVLIKQIVDAGVSPEQPFAGFNINIEAQIRDGVTRYLH